MANTKSATKAARKSARFAIQNRGVKTALKTLKKSLAAAMAAKDPAAAKTAGIAYVKAMDKAVKSGVIHRNAADRAKARASGVIFAK